MYSLLSMYVLAQQAESWREHSMIVSERGATEGEREKKEMREEKRDRKGKREADRRQLSAVHLYLGSTFTFHWFPML